jgi:hypothetical protein
MGKKQTSVHLVLQDHAVALEKSDGIVTIFVASAGIGRMGFKAYHVTDNLDRQDGDDEGISDTPGEALRYLADKLDQKLIKEAWEARLDALRKL